MNFAAKKHNYSILYNLSLIKKLPVLCRTGNLIELYTFKGIGQICFQIVYVFNTNG
jgi:hypothetical protein